jgi:ABC-type transport system involved in cytochrome c biogenesis permease component
MNGIWAVIVKEWKCFIGSDRGMFVLYMFLVLTWSVLLATRSSANFNAGPLWLVFFSVVITANFSNTIFISERVSGALEILITSGFSRNAVLYGKMAFILGMSLIFGILCISLTFLFEKFIYNNDLHQIDISGFFLYAGSAFLNVASSAYLSVRMSNPRLLHFANMFLLGTVVGTYMLLSSMFNVHLFFLILFFCVTAVLICWRAQILYNSEKILQPIYM